MACGASTGAKTDKVAANNIEMMAVEGSDIQIPADTRLAMVATLQQSVEVGDHILHICQVDKFLGDEDKKGLYAWNGFGKVAPAVRRLNLKTVRRRQRWLFVLKTVFRT